MMWLWDASTSLDVAAYIIYLCVLQPDLSHSPWSLRATAPATTLQYTDNLPDPPLGRAWVYDVEARDAADNESSR